MSFVGPFSSVSPVTSAPMSASSENYMRESGENITRNWGERIASFLRSIHPYATAKLVARDAKVPVRTVEKWLDGTSAPSLDHFMRVLAAYAPEERQAMEARILEVQAKRRRAIEAMRGDR